MFSYFCATGTRRLWMLLTATMFVVAVSLNQSSSTNSAELQTTAGSACCCRGLTVSELARNPSPDLFDVMRVATNQGNAATRKASGGSDSWNNASATPSMEVAAQVGGGFGGDQGCIRFGGAPPAPATIPTDLFLAIDQGSIQARMIVRSQYQAKLILTNQSAVSQLIEVPDVLGARPILAQQNSFFGPQTGGSNRNVGSTGAIAPQSVGGSPQGMGSTRTNSNSGFPSIFNGGNMNNVFNIAPEQVRTVEIKCLCLEHGKPNPRSTVQYELVRLAEVNDDPKLAEVLKSYGRGEADRDTAQAAAWHLANEMGWDELASLSQKIALNASRPWFSTGQLRAAKQLVDDAKPVPTVSANKVVKLPKL